MVALGTAAAIAVMPGSTAHANPSAADTARALNALGTKLDATNEELNSARVLLTRSRQKQAELNLQVRVYRTRTQAYEKRVGEIAAAAYRGGNASMMNALLSGGSPQTVLDQLAVLEVVSQDDKDQIQQLIKAKKPLEAAKRKLDAEVAKQAAQEKTLRDRKAALDKDLAKWKALDAQLPRGSRSSGRTDTTPTNNVPVSGRAGAVVSFAYAQIGEPYSFGASGPRAWDCSGLTMMSWAQAGKSLPHSARQQFEQLPRVSRSNMRPGDIVFFYSPVSHNGIYVGGNKVVHAPQPGQSVTEASIDSMPFTGAARPS